jgi:hypothetical protein
MNPIRHRSPKVENNLSNNYFKSTTKKEINYINFSVPESISNISNNSINNISQFNYEDYNYYDEIKKAFNFITFILKQKDNQIMKLKSKLHILQQKLSQINSKNIISSNNNKELILNTENIEDNISNINIENNVDANNNYNYKTTTFNNNQNKKNIPPNESNMNKFKQSSSSLLAIQTKNNNINSINAKNIESRRMSQNNTMYNKNTNNTNIIHKIKKISNINKINDYNKEIINEHDNNEYNSININNDIIKNEFNLNMNMNINEHSNEKRNINQIRKEPYHMKNHKNYNNNIVKIRNNNYQGSPKFKRGDDPVALKEKMKILFLDNSGNNKTNSKSNSFSLSDDGNIIQSKKDVKNYLKEVKTKLQPNKFKKFISLIKCLIKNKNSIMKNQIINDIRNILIDKNLINKFDTIMKIK